MRTLGMLLKEKASSAITTVAPGLTVSAAVGAMIDANVGATIVLEGQRLLGILTERDVMVRVVGQRRDPDGTTVADVMTSPVCTATRATGIHEAMTLMSRRRHRHLPVVEDGVVYGLISMGDVTLSIIREQAEQFDHVIGAVKHMGYAHRRG